jgi:hypothetical protein
VKDAIPVAKNIQVNMHAKYNDIDSTNWAQYLLTAGKLKQNYYALRSAKDEHKKATDDIEFWCKYGRKHWFRKTMGNMSEFDVEVKIHRLQRLIDSLQCTIDECNMEIHWHLIATEELRNSMKPYEGLNMKEIELKQQTLFL